ncbi:hypothetical protein JQC67_02045 [Aurantibacter crassamenti]|uniref:hypothetical protein n=1 Tax=Aurantibacter crassamenti TaxID=1837375 RepID=UPI00193A7797|nr:hypothetical protein [Aurantibacter crassamenti]MBM1104909.1 hypothetical protein [Aurantibacter crassamenti]
MKKTVVNHEISAIEIDASNCFEINMKTSATDELNVQATIEGEYTEDLLLNLKEEGTNIFVSAGFVPNFKNPNDKLSAHKVVSIALEITVPQNHTIQVNGASCNVSVTGIYKHLKITLNDGICTLINVSENVMATTQSGDINIVSDGAIIQASSSYGIVEKNEIPVGENYFTVKTTTGNINLDQSE